MQPKNITFGYLAEKKNAKIKEIPMPELAEDELLVKQEACNICTTDYQQWLGLREHQGYPMAGGHECSGIVIAKGKAVGDTYQIGDRVSVLYDYCGYCDECKFGEITNCENKRQFGKNYSKEFYGIFGFANYFVRKAKSFVKMRPTLSASEAAFVEPLSSVVQNMKKLRIVPGKETIVIIGGGTMGLLNGLTARAMGARVIISEVMPKKLALIKELGFEAIDASQTDPVQKVKELTNGRGADSVIVAVGSTLAMNQSLEMVKEKDGKISIYAAGYPAPEMAIQPNTIHYMRLEVIGTYASTLEDFYDAATLLNEGRVDVSKLIETKVPLMDIQKAFEIASTLGSYRVSVVLNEEGNKE